MKDFIKKLFSHEIIRFIIAGGINTLLGGILLPTLFNLAFGKMILFTFLSTNAYWGLLVGYLLWFIPAYFIQIKFVFKTKFQLVRFIAYPFTQIPNFIINSLFYYLFGDICGLNSGIYDFIALGLAAAITVPIMFVLVRLVVKAKPKKDEKKGPSE